MNTLTPKQIVTELDKYIVGQDDAKKAVAVALRNRYRRMQLPEDIREEVTPKNILMVGPTGVGKTEIARRLAKLVDAPFVKVEATKFTEVGYVGRDVDSIIRDLTEAGIRMIKEQQTRDVHDLAVQAANNRIVELITHPVKKRQTPLTSSWATAPRNRSSAARKRKSFPPGARTCAAPSWRGNLKTTSSRWRWRSLRPAPRSPART